MEESNEATFIDHKESTLGIPRPHRMDASKTDITPAEGCEMILNSETQVPAQMSSQETTSTVSETLAASEMSAQEIQIASSLPTETSDTLSLSTAPPDSSSVSGSVNCSEMQVSVEKDVPHTSEQKTDNSYTTTEELASATEENQHQEGAAQDISNGEPLWSEVLEVRRPEEEKEASEYCPGLAIRSLALEDFMDKRSGPSSTPSGTETLSASISSEAETSQMMSQSDVFSPNSASPKKPLFDPIEVERKFTIAEDTEDKLKSLGARLHKEKVFTDVYYDNDDYSLILSDCWLRRRNNAWEAKVPAKCQQPHAPFAPATQYREITEERAISTWLVDQLKLDSWLRGDPIDLLVQAAGLTPFAKFTTTRRTYNLPPCVVDLDLTDHGFRVGEIEVMAASPEEVPQALQTISSVAQKLGVKENDRTLGKMSQYLLRFKPWLYHRLVKPCPSPTPST